MTALSSEEKLAVIIMEKLAFFDGNLDDQLQYISTSHNLIQQNDVYHVLLSDSYKEGDKPADDQKITIIYPATQKHVDKVCLFVSIKLIRLTSKPIQYSKASISLFRETPQKYNDIVKPYIDSLPAKETKW